VNPVYNSSFAITCRNFQYTITPLLNLGIPLHNVHQLATALHCHVLKSLNKITRYVVIIGDLMGGYWLSGWLQEG
jgi:hypothetical protein